MRAANVPYFRRPSCHDDAATPGENAPARPDRPRRRAPSAAATFDDDFNRDAFSSGAYIDTVYCWLRAKQAVLEGEKYISAATTMLTFGT